MVIFYIVSFSISSEASEPIDEASLSSSETPANALDYTDSSGLTGTDIVSTASPSTLLESKNSRTISGSEGHTRPESNLFRTEL